MALIFCAVLIYGGTAVAMGNPDNNTGYMLLFIAVLIPSLFFMITIHELGHVLASRLVRASIYNITIGSGSAISKFRIFDIDIELRSVFFLGGSVLPYFVNTSPRKWKVAIILLGGVAGNSLCATALLIVISTLAKWSNPNPFLLTILSAMATTQLFGLLNLWPFNARRGGGQIASDGLQLLRLLTFKTYGDEARLQGIAHAAVSLRRSRKFAEAAALSMQGWTTYPDQGGLFGMVVDCIGKARGPRPAVQFYLDRASTLPEVRPHGEDAWSNAHGNVAWHALMAEEAAWLDMAEQLSARAFEASPLQPEIKATRGAARLVLGEYEEGSQWIRESMRRLEEADDKAEFCAFLGRAERNRGNEERAAEFESLARHLWRSVGSERSGI